LESPLGRDVRVGGEYYKVIGIMEPAAYEAKSDDISMDQAKPAAHRMFIPLETARSRYGEVVVRRRSGSTEAERVELHELTVKVGAIDEVTSAADAIRAVLQRNHPKKDYQMVVPLELLKRAERTKEIFNIVLGSIAAISL